MKIIIDTNDFISAIIGKNHRQKLAFVLNQPDIEVFASEDLLREIRDVGYREKFRKYVSIEDVDIFIEVLQKRLTLVKTTSLVFDSPDPDDNYLLALAIDSNADYLITGDKKHLLSLNPYQGVPIIRLDELLTILQKR